MCTLTWLCAARDYQVFFNRDELKTRKPAFAPTPFSLQGTNVLAPRDGDAGGTWIAVNEWGVTLCLLNNYETAATQQGNNWDSRGHLVRALAHLKYDAITSTLTLQTLDCYPAFDLFIFGIGRDPVRFAWDGDKLRRNDSPVQPVTSSSFDTAAVIRSRRASYRNLFEDIPANEESLKAFHASHSPDKSAYSVCMHRDKAHTVSFSHIGVNEERVCFSYRDGPPCTHNEPITLALATKTASATEVA